MSAVKSYNVIRKCTNSLEWLRNTLYTDLKNKLNYQGRLIFKFTVLKPANNKKNLPRNFLVCSFGHQLESLHVIPELSALHHKICGRFRLLHRLPQEELESGIER